MVRHFSINFTLYSKYINILFLEKKIWIENLEVF